MRGYAIALFVLMLMQLVPTRAHALTDEERATLVEQFGKMKDLRDFSAQTISAALNDPEFEEFFGGFAQTVTVIQYADKIADAKDAEAFKMLAAELGGEAIKRLAPRVAGAMNFIGYVNTGLGLFKDYVFDPWLEKKRMKAYVAQRENGQEPADAIVTTGSWGDMRIKALKQLEKQGYDMSLLWEDGEVGKLTPAWEKKLLHFVTASMEAQYERKILEDEGKKGKKELPKLGKQAKKILKQHDDGSGGEDTGGDLAGHVESFGDKDVEWFINGKKVEKPKKGNFTFTLDKGRNVQVRMMVVGARRAQSRGLKAKRPKGVTLDGEPTDYEFAYSMGGNESSWSVVDETYDWSISARTNKTLGQSFKGSHTVVKKDIVTLTLAADTGSETITIDVSGNVRWEMTGKRANGSAAADASDEGKTSSIVLVIAPKK